MNTKEKNTKERNLQEKIKYIWCEIYKNFYKNFLLKLIPNI